MYKFCFVVLHYKLVKETIQCVDSILNLSNHPLEIVIDADEEEIKQGLGYTVLTRTLQFLKAYKRILFFL